MKRYIFNMLMLAGIAVSGFSLVACNDEWIVVSPWALVWEDEYYMVAYDENDDDP